MIDTINCIEDIEDDLRYELEHHYAHDMPSLNVIAMSKAKITLLQSNKPKVSIFCLIRDLIAQEVATQIGFFVEVSDEKPGSKIFKKAIEMLTKYQEEPDKHKTYPKNEYYNPVEDLDSPRAHNKEEPDYEVNPAIKIQPSDKSQALDIPVINEIIHWAVASESEGSTMASNFEATLYIERHDR